MVDIFIAPKKNKITEISVNKVKKKIIKNNNSEFPRTVNKKNVNILTSFKLKPEGISFRDQGADEKIYLFLRSHLVTNVPWIITVFVFSILPIFGFILFNNSFVPFTLPLSYIPVS